MQEKTAYIAALHILALRDYTVSALKKKLQAKGFMADVVVVAIERLKTEGLLNDFRYAERFVSNARENGRYVGYRLKQEMLRRGVPGEIVKDLLDNVTDPSEDFLIATDLVNRRYPDFAASHDAGKCRKIAGFLQRRGFSSRVVWSVIRNSGADPASGAGDDFPEYS